MELLESASALLERDVNEDEFDEVQVISLTVPVLLFSLEHVQFNRKLQALATF